MKKTALVVTFLVISLSIGLFWGYDQYYSTGEFDIWSIVPPQSGLVYEPQNGRKSIESLFQGEFGKVFAESPPGKKLRENLTFLDSLFGHEAFNKILLNAEPLVIANPISSTEPGFLVIARVKNLKPSAPFKRGMAELTSRYKIGTRNYNNHTINEIAVGNKLFAFASIKGFWFGSFTSVMVEDVIRQFSESQNKDFRSGNPELFAMAKMNGDDGNIYINSRQFTRIINLFLDPMESIDDLSTIAGSAFFDVNISDNALLLNGFSYEGVSSSRFGKLKSVEPYRTNIRLYIPSSTAIFQHFLLPKIDTEGDLSGLLSSLAPELGLAHMEASSLSEADYLIFVRLKDEEKGRSALKTLAESSVQGNDTVYYEYFSEFTITELNVENLYQNISDYIPFESNTQYYTIVNDLLIFGNSVQVLKDFILDIESENTWGKSVVKTGYLEKSLDHAAYSLYFEVPKVLYLFGDKFHDRWGKIISQYDNLLRKFRMGTVQYSYTDNKLYTNIALSVDTKNSFTITDRKKLDPNVKTELPEKITIAPSVVRNHVDQSWEMIAQTSDNILTLVSDKGVVQWTDSLQGKIIDKIEQIDYYKNGKLQYFFATDSALHIIDRNGFEIDGYPLKLNYKVDKVNVVDYNNSRAYRFITSDIKGNVYMYDKGGNNLNGWNPNEAGGRLLVPPRHIRVRGRDCILLLQEKGLMILTNRRGGILPGFPLKIGVGMSEEYGIEYGNDFESSYVVLITTDGILKKVSLTGKVDETRQVMRLKRDSKFSLVPDVLGKDYIIARKEISTFTLLDKNGKDIFMENLISSNDFLWQYYNFGSNRKLYVVTDPEQEFSYLYNEKGELINRSPINSKYNIGVIFSESKNEFKIFSAYDRYLNIYSF